MSIIGARFPGRYLQGPGLLSMLGTEAANFGTSAIVILDRTVFGLLESTIRSGIGESVALNLVQHGGECSESEIARMKALSGSADVVIGAGGGKTLDTAKAVAHQLSLPCVIVPTIAASDAPCSALAVIYNDDGSVGYDLFLPRNPDLVVVDTTVIAAAPARFLVAGIGDALATWYEAESCRLSGANNCMKTHGAPLAYEIARFCGETVLEFGVAALGECDRKAPGPALERIVEANILLSGIGFESGGVAAAHAIHHGLCELDDVHGYLHGEKVTIGVLAGLLLHGDQTGFESIRAFCAAVRLPTRLADIGIADATDEKLAIVAKRACRAGEIIHNEPIPVTPDMVVAALRYLI
jgi:glycerol dehydrogenase